MSDHSSKASKIENDLGASSEEKAMTQILVVDDETDIRDLIEYNLTQNGYKVLTADNGSTALELAQSRAPDLIVLDVMMPGLSGIEVAKQLRTQTQTNAIPILMLTAKTEEVHELEGLDSGADDYMSKPFSMQVLIARINALLRRRGPTTTKAKRLSIGPVEVDLNEHRVCIDDEPIQLTITEFRLLASLIASNGAVLSRPELINRAIGPGVTVTERTVDVHITALRKKLGDHAGLIATVRGVGYRTEDPQHAE